MFKLPDLSRFLLPPFFSGLQRVASGGPVVTVRLASIVAITNHEGRYSGIDTDVSCLDLDKACKNGSAVQYEEKFHDLLAGTLARGGVSHRRFLPGSMPFSVPHLVEPYR